MARDTADGVDGVARGLWLRGSVGRGRGRDEDPIHQTIERLLIEQLLLRWLVNCGAG